MIHNMSPSNNSALKISFGLLFAILVFAAFIPAAVAANQTTTAPLYISYLCSPGCPNNTLNVHKGQTVTVTILGKNTGGTAFIVTGCTEGFHYGTNPSAPFQTIPCFPKYHGYPIVVPPKSTGTKVVSPQKVGISEKLTFQIKLEAKGTYGGVQAVSHPGILTVIIS